MAELFRVSVLALVRVGELPVRSIWIALAETPEDAARIVRTKVASGCEVKVSGTAAPELAERFGLAIGQARLL